jgi:AraC family transcriptional regulator
MEDKYENKQKCGSQRPSQNDPCVIRHIGPYKGDALLFERLWGKLCTWAGAKGLLQQPDLKSLVIYHDDPKVTWRINSV